MSAKQVDKWGKGESRLKGGYSQDWLPHWDLEAEVRCFPVVFGAVAGLIETLIPVDQAADAGGRKIRPNLHYFRREVASRIVLLALAVCQLGKQLGLFERLLTDGLAFGPQGTELSHIILNGAVDALL